MFESRDNECECLGEFDPEKTDAVDKSLSESKPESDAMVGARSRLPVGYGSRLLS
jgi:hypothetical protein